MGLRGNLTAGEIVEQLLHAKAVTPIHNVVFMVRQCSYLPVRTAHSETLPLCRAWESRSTTTLLCETP